MTNWLHSVLSDAAGIRGREVIPRVIPVASPATATDWTLPVTAGTVWKVQSLLMTLTTDATAPARGVSLVISDGSTTFIRIPAANTQAASLTGRYSFLVDIGSTVTISPATGILTPFPSSPILGGWTISSLTSNFGAADAYSAIALYVLEIEQTPYDIEVARDLTRLAGSRSDSVPQLGLEN